MASAVDLLSPVLPSASASLAGIAGNLNQAADRQVQLTGIAATAAAAKARIASEERQTTAQIKATASEHEKYQKFQGEQNAQEQAARAAEAEKSREAMLEVRKQENEHDKAMADKHLGVQVGLAKLHMQYLAGVGEDEQAFYDAAKPLKVQNAEIASDMAAIEVARGKTQAEIQRSLEAMGPVVEQELKRMDDTETVTKDMARKTVDAVRMKGADKLADPSLGYRVLKKFGSFTPGQVSPASKFGQMAQDMTGPAMREKAAVEAADQFALNSTTLKPEDRPKLEAFLSGVIEMGEAYRGTATGQGVPAGMEQKAKELKKLHDEIVQSDPLKSSEIKYFIDNFSKSSAEMADVTSLEKAIAVAQGADKDAARLQPHEIEAMATAFKGMSRARLGYDAVGTGAPSRTEIALGMAKLKAIAGGLTGMEDVAKNMQDLPPVVQEHVNRYFEKLAGKDLPEKFAARKKQVEDYKGKEKQKVKNEGELFELETRQKGAPFKKRVSEQMRQMDEMLAENTR